MTIHSQQREQIQMGVRSDFLTRLESYVRRIKPQALANTPPPAVRGALNQSINKAAGFGMDRERAVEQFVALDLSLGSNASRFYARQDVRLVQTDRSQAPSARVKKLELLAQAKPLI